MVSGGGHVDEEKATRGRRGRKRRKGRGRICRDCAHNDEVIHGLLRNLGRHVDSFRNYRFEGSFGIDASESDATKLDASRRRYVVAGSRWVKTTSEQLAALLVFSCNRPPGGRDELRGAGHWAYERANDLFLRGYHHNDKQRAKPLPRRIPIPSAQSTTKSKPPQL
jgi:hypothetical protein